MEGSARRHVSIISSKYEVGLGDSNVPLRVRLQLARVRVGTEPKMALSALFLVLLSARAILSWQTCATGEFRCDTGRCIPRKFVCDAWIHCRDGSDEANCTESSCAPGAFWCDNGCRAKEERCNGRKWCKDNADEKDCPPRSANQSYTCPGADGRYYEPIVVCDVDCNCDDCGDEANCTKKEQCSRASGAFFCDGECRHRDRWCDRVADCSDGMDEKNCPYNKNVKCT